MRTVNNCIKGIEKEKKIGCTILVDSSTNKMSSITNPETLLDTDDYVASNSHDALEDSNITSDENEHPNILGGHPKGSTVANRSTKKRKLQLQWKMQKQYRRAQK